MFGTYYMLRFNMLTVSAGAVMVADMPQTRTDFGGAFVGGFLFAVGGDPNSTVIKFSRKENMWVAQNSLSSPRDGAQVATLDSDEGIFMYAVGGSTLTAVNKVERFSPAGGNSWQVMAGMNTARSGGML
jgi:hypothetical protein